MNLTMLLELGEDGFWIATIPEIPGAFSQGKTQQEARENVIEALEELMAARREMAIQAKHESGIVERFAILS